MSTQQHPAHDASITVQDAKVDVRRTFGLVRRLEQQYGPITQMAARVKSRLVPFDELAGLVATLIAGEADEVSDEHLERARVHIMDDGIQNISDEVDDVLYLCTVGNKRAQEILQKLADEQTDEYSPIGRLDENPTTAA